MGKPRKPEPRTASATETVTPTPKQVWLKSLLERGFLDVERLMVSAPAVVNEAGRRCAWMAGERQVDRFVLALQPYLRVKNSRPERDSYLSSYLAKLEAHAATARAAIESFDDQVRQEAKAGLGLRVAVVGKGGSGKTFIAGTLSRVLAQRGRRVLAADLDTNPGLSYTLGLGPSDGGLPDEALEQDPGADYGWHLAPHLNPADVVLADLRALRAGIPALRS